MPNRIIKESICTSDTIDLLTADEERFFYRLIVQADDFGRFDGRAPVVLAGAFPLRAHEIHIDQIEAWLQRLAEVDLIRFYHVEGRRYLHFTTWDKHQQRRAKYSKFPEPPADGRHLKSSDITCDQPQAHVPEESRIENTRSERRDNAPAREVAVSADTDSTDLLSSPEWSAVTTHYHNVIGMMGPTQFEKLKFWVDKLPPEVICSAIDETKANADTPGMAYIDGILRNWHNQGVTSLADVEAQRDKRSRGHPRNDYDTAESMRRAVARLDELGIGEGA